MPIITSNGAGNTKVTTRSGKELNLSNQETRRDTTGTKRYATVATKNKFKLVTVRRLTNLTQEELDIELQASYQQLEAAALRTGKPVPYPIKPVTNEQVNNVYGVFIDEDLYGRNLPIYTFLSSSVKVKCFITTTGVSKQDWSVHIAHGLERTPNANGTFTTKWRLVTIDNSETFKVFHILEDSALPKCFSFNFDIDSLNYIGGGTWTAMAVDKDDRLPIYAIAPGDTQRYIKVGSIFRSMGESRVKSLVAYSMTPTFVFTWQRGQLKVNKRERDAKQTVDISKLTADGVISFTRNHNYTLNIPWRLENKTDPYDISEVIHTEYSRGSATYVGNTNAPAIGSRFQNPDYGTDTKRLSISNIDMATNVVRPTSFEYTYNLVENRISKCPLSYIPIICASADMGLYLQYEFGEATGVIDHPYEIKRVSGKRGFQYGESYKLWWGYGKVLETFAYGDTDRYRLLKSPGFDEKGNRLPDRVRIGSMFDLGELRISDEHPNAVETTWDSYINPPTGFFGLEEGTLTFWVVYLNPPIIGHDGVYYYHINPPIVGAGSGAYELDEFGIQNDLRNQQNNYKYLYSQLLGALGGGSLESLDIGDIVIAANDKESIVVREPNSTQKAILLESPETFPAGYFDADIYDFVLDTTNQGLITVYGSDGNVVNEYKIA